MHNQMQANLPKQYPLEYWRKEALCLDCAVMSIRVNGLGVHCYFLVIGSGRYSLHHWHLRSGKEKKGLVGHFLETLFGNRIRTRIHLPASLYVVRGIRAWWENRTALYNRIKIRFHNFTNSVLCVSAM
jgi:hypothetical protein